MLNAAEPSPELFAEEWLLAGASRSFELFGSAAEPLLAVASIPAGFAGAEGAVPWSVLGCRSVAFRGEPVSRAYVLALL